VLTTKKKHPVLSVRFEPHGNTETFSELAVLGLTEREIEALSYLPLGYTNKQIAMAMSIGEDGVKKYFKRLSRKLNASGRTELLYQALTLKRTIKLYGSL
jgi:DNA-binding NarL/FixJ family response regulator